MNWERSSLQSDVYLYERQRLTRQTCFVCVCVCVCVSVCITDDRTRALIAFHRIILRHCSCISSSSDVVCCISQHTDLLLPYSCWRVRKKRTESEVLISTAAIRHQSFWSLRDVMLPTRRADTILTTLQGKRIKYLCMKCGLLKCRSKFAALKGKRK
jgi:hypothetical protein